MSDGFTQMSQEKVAEGFAATLEALKALNEAIDRLTQQYEALAVRLAELEAWKKRGAPNEDGPILC
jgi:predicted transcriptional regulator